jgi:ribosomal protein S18 acetylase RimI-like enzyme
MLGALREPVSDRRACVIAPASPTSAEAETCLQAYFRELNQRFPTRFDAEKSVSAAPEEVTPPHGQFLLVTHETKPVGCGAVKALAPGIGEIKRMWIAPHLRGMGLGKELLVALERAAMSLGLTCVRLDTSAHLPEAIALYRRSGYREIPAYNANPYAAHWFEKQLAP